jgi:hypothetical protein
MILKILKWIGVLIVVAILIFLLGMLYFRETWGGAYLHVYVSPTHPEYKVELYDYDTGPLGDPYFSMYSVGPDGRRYLGDFDLADTQDSLGRSLIAGAIRSEWTPWNSELRWSADGKVVFCTDQAFRAAYGFEEKCLLVRSGLPISKGLKSVRVVAPEALALLLAHHGGEGFPPFEFYEDPKTLVWQDFIPWKN